MHVVGIRNVQVLRQDEYPLTDGKEAFYKWQIDGDNDVSCLANIYMAREGSGDRYSVFADIAAWIFKTDAGQQRAAYRLDTVTLTTIQGDGSNDRFTATVPVRTDFSQFEGMDVADMIRFVAQAHTASGRTAPAPAIIDPYLECIAACAEYW